MSCIKCHKTIVLHKNGRNMEWEAIIEIISCKVLLSLCMKAMGIYSLGNIIRSHIAVSFISVITPFVKTLTI